MKTLDSASLHEGINATLKEISHVQAKITEIQKGVRGIIDLENYLRGRTGESIRSFYEGIHAPFLIFLYQSLTHYRQTLEKLQQAVQSYEPNEQGLVREEFLEVDVQNGLDKAERVAADLVDEANGIMASVSDLVSLPKLDMEEFSSMVQKGKKKVKNNIEQLYNLDYEQTKSLTKVGEDLTLLNQYINEMSRTFASDYSITTFNALTALKLPSLPTILKEVYGEPVIEEKEETSLWTKIVDGAVELGKGIVNTSKGAAIGVYDVGKDTLVGIGNTIIHPIETVDSTANMVIHPVETGKYIGNAIAESFERDMINGDAESRSHWVTYALGTVATTVFGTKGAGTVTKTGVATTKTGAKKAAAAVENIDLSRFLPYAPQYQLAGRSRVPYNVVDGNYLKDQLILQAEVLQGNERNIRGIKRTDNGKFGKYSTNIDDKVKVIEKEDLPYWISESFTDSVYRTVVTKENITFYRSFGGGARANGAFVTTSSAGNRINAKINTALVPDWGNTRQYEAVIEVPKGEVLNIGRVEKQYTKTGTLLDGDGDQILLPQEWPSEWIKEIREVPSR